MSLLLTQVIQAPPFNFAVREDQSPTKKVDKNICLHFFFKLGRLDFCLIKNKEPDSRVIRLLAPWDNEATS